MSWNCHWSVLTCLMGGCWIGPRLCRPWFVNSFLYFGYILWRQSMYIYNHCFVCLRFQVNIPNLSISKRRVKFFVLIFVINFVHIDHANVDKDTLIMRLYINGGGSFSCIFLFLPFCHVHVALYNCIIYFLSVYHSPLFMLCLGMLKDNWHAMRLYNI